MYHKVLFLLPFVMATACNNATKEGAANKETLHITGHSVTYNADTIKAEGYVAYNDAQEGKRPGVLIVHEWWGLTDYARERAKQLASLGYIALAVDMYGSGRLAADPKEAQDLATPFYKDPNLAKTRLEAGLDQLKSFPETDTANIAAIGYCFGGYVVLNSAKLGADLNGVVSFHGGLGGAPPQKDALKAKILVCHGEADQFVSDAEVKTFKKQMDSVSANYTFRTYANATHAFTNPQATEIGKKFSMPIEYNAAADTASWNDMKNFFDQVFLKQ